MHLEGDLRHLPLINVDLASGLVCVERLTLKGQHPPLSPRGGGWGLGGQPAGQQRGISLWCTQVCFSPPTLVTETEYD
jgi:hypothetical protein